MISAEQHIEGFRTYKVEQAKKDFKPNTRLQYLPWCWRGFDMEFILHENCWWPEGAPGRGQWWKVGSGITSAIGANNSSAALVGVQSTDFPGTMFATAYTNARDKSWEVGNLKGQHPGFNQIDFRVQQLMKVKCRILRRPKVEGLLEGAIMALVEGPQALWDSYWVARYEFSRDGDTSPVIWEHPFQAPWYGLYRQAGGWAGGTIPSFQDMSYDMKIKMLR